MRIQLAHYTDKGTRKNTNEDSLLIRTASTRIGDIVMALVCDGMGGLNRGELASSSVVQAFSDWFESKLPVFLENGYDFGALRSGLEFEIRRQSRLMEEYARRNGIRLGTTLTMLLLCGDRCVTVNVGDSRIYEISDRILQLTKDQSLVQREIDAGRLDPSMAEQDDRRNILLQCVGETSNLAPDIREIPFHRGAVYLLCSDGFRHELHPEELRSEVRAAADRGENALAKCLERLTRTVMDRGETDNITAVAVRVG